MLIKQKIYEKNSVLTPTNYGINTPFLFTHYSQKIPDTASSVLFFSKMSCKIPCHKHFCHFIIISLNCIQDIFMVSYHIIMLSGLLCCFFILYCFYLLFTHTPEPFTYQFPTQVFFAILPSELK